MSLDKFGRFSQIAKNKRKNTFKKPTDPIAFTLDHDENINIHSKRIKKLSSPTEGTDAVNKDFLIAAINEFRNQISSEIEGCEERVNNEVEQIYKHIESIRGSLMENIQVYTEYVDKRVTETLTQANESVEKTD